MLHSSSLLLILSIILFTSTSVVAGDGCTCDKDPNSLTLKYKLFAILASLVLSAVGVFLPIVRKNFPALHRETNLLISLVKSFAAGVILSVGFIHILPDAFESLTSPCLKEKPWGSFPFAGLAAMVGSLGSLGIDAFAIICYFRRASGDGHEDHVHLHTRTTHGAHPAASPPGDLDRIKYSQVLKQSIIVNSAITGIAMGSSKNPSTIKHLMVALCLSQMFEGIKLGGRIARASFKLKSAITMGLFFSLTAPVGIGIGIGIMNVCSGNSPTALIVRGLLDACVAGILIYIALLDLLARHFKLPKLQSSTKLFLGATICLVMGSFMALLAI